MDQLTEEPRNHAKSASVPEDCEHSKETVSEPFLWLEGPKGQGRECASGSRTTAADSLWVWEETTRGTSVCFTDGVVYVNPC